MLLLSKNGLLERVHCFDIVNDRFVASSNPVSYPQKATLELKIKNKN